METKLGGFRGDSGLKLEGLVEICDEVEEEQHEVFGPQIKLDLGTGSSNHDLGEPPVEVVKEEDAVEVIRVESSEENPDEEMGTGDMPVHGDVKMGIGDDPILEDVELGRGDTPAHRVVAGDSFLEDYPGMILKSWEKSTLRKP